MKSYKGAIVLVMAVVLIAVSAMISFSEVGGELGASGIHLGLDLAGGVSITYQAAEGSDPTEQEMEGALSVIRHRLDAKGYTEASAFLDGTDRIRVEIPGLGDASQAVNEIGRTAMLRFVGIDLERLLSSDVMEEFYQRYLEDVRAMTKDEKVDPEQDSVLVNDDGTYSVRVADLSDEDILADAENYFHNYIDGALDRYPELLDRAIEMGYAKDVLDGSHVKAASYQKESLGNQGVIQSYVKLEFDEQGKTMFAEGTANYLGKYIGIFLDDDLISIPTVSNVINDGEAVITNIGSDEEAKSLADDIVGGALKVELVDIEHNAVGATLGRDALETSIKAGIIGFCIIVLFLCIFYKVPGLMASLSLIFYVSLELILINAFDWTLTLAGVAGFILSIGMAVDANIIIFSRVTEELDLGHTVRVSVRSGFKKALSAILDGNITTMIAALVLYFAGSGTIKGFAQTLGLGICLSMICALLVTRLLLSSAVSVLPDKPKAFRVIKLKKEAQEA